LQLIEEDFRKHGQTVLQRVREKHPQIYLMGILGLLPKQQQKIESPLADLSDEEIAMVEEYLAASRARLVKKIERHNGTQSFPLCFPGSCRQQVMLDIAALLAFVLLLDR
jgi:hypothetical protein